jgi:hypothetical protein
MSGQGDFLPNAAIDSIFGAFFGFRQIFSKALPSSGRPKKYNGFGRWSPVAGRRYGF